MKKLILPLVAIVATTGTLYAQTGADALRFSQTNYGSTARFKSMGGAQIGVGGDMSSLGANPAGLGLFTKSEFSLTPELDMMRGNASYLGDNTKSSKNTFNLNNVGAVFYSPTFKPKGQDASKGLISAVFGVGFNRTNDYSANFNYGGLNKTSSIADYFAEEANYRTGKKDPSFIQDGTIEAMAYDTRLIAYKDATTGYEPTLDFNNQQRQSEIRRGSNSEVNVAGALNISNQFYIGASLNFVNVRYLNDKEYRESGYNFDTQQNSELTYFQNQEVKGSGFNGRLGVIFRPESNLRIGATFQTPTWLYFNDDLSFTLNTKILGGVDAGTYTNKPSFSGITYRLRTPLKGSLGASYVIANRALISADVDYIDYSSMHYSIDQDNNQFDIASANRDIKSFYKEAVNFRVGAEFKIDNSLSLRGGFANNGSALKNDDDHYFATKIYTGGLGYRINNYYVDLAYQRVESNTDLSPYLLDNQAIEPVANIKTNRNNVFLTLGVRF